MDRLSENKSPCHGCPLFAGERNYYDARHTNQLNKVDTGLRELTTTLKHDVDSRLLLTPLLLMRYLQKRRRLLYERLRLEAAYSPPTQGTYCSGQELLDNRLRCPRFTAKRNGSDQSKL